MKEATGEMTMTIVVIVAAVAILAIAPTIWKIIQGKIEGEVNNMNTSIDKESLGYDYYKQLVDDFYA
ncbi:MAG: hypothetical protein PUD59_00105 [bacterium]|nr:hypothetical protein [bacterium]